jgi:CcmD family protein
MVFLAAAFAVVWLVVGLYVAYIGRRQNQLAAELETLTEVVEAEQ